MKIVDINSDQYDFFKPSAGDRFQVEQIIEKYNNRVIVNGAVYRPGTYSVTDGMTVKNLIDKAEGLKTDVFFDKAYVTRTNEDYSTSTIALDLEDELKNPSFILNEEDILNLGEAVIEAKDCDILYEVALKLKEQNLDDLVCEHFRLKTDECDLTEWTALVQRVKSLAKEVTIALVGKYVSLQDAYLSVSEALSHAGYHHHAKVNIKWINACSRWISSKPTIN